MMVGMAVVHLFIQLVFLIFLALCCHWEDHDDGDGGDCQSWC